MFVDVAQKNMPVKSMTGSPPSTEQARPDELLIGPSAGFLKLSTVMTFFGSHCDDDYWVIIGHL